MISKRGDGLMNNILTIAGSDTISGGGLQADLRTFQEYGMNGLNVLTCIATLSDTQMIQVDAVQEELLNEQLNQITTYLPQLNAIKLGMLGTVDNAVTIARFLARLREDIPVIIDPVLALKESPLTLELDAVTVFQEQLLPLATIVTPNLREAELLSGMTNIASVDDMKQAAANIFNFGAKQVVIKGGARIPGSQAVDVFYDGSTYRELVVSKLPTNTTNGAGCTFASAIACGLAKGLPAEQAVADSKEFVYYAIKYGQPFSEDYGNVWQGGLAKHRKERALSHEPS
ncbi:bifunctional hydroxymethylpyrimidine kinase/phosphomethylpyrimidine kinase [Vagococcus acidifermentans]|nr:bifunctional hydroxymethylpyrimidine kinase/phosphomethylpyrimidine kinase [Vagococcus acidifermentans]